MKSGVKAPNIIGNLADLESSESSSSESEEKQVKKEKTRRKRRVIDTPKASKAKEINMNTCAICLDEITIEKEVRLDSCSHKYCGQCIT